MSDVSEIIGLLDIRPSNARDPETRSEIENELKQELMEDVPAMVTRLARLEDIFATDVEGAFLCEAVEAFQYGLWRAVIGLVGIVAERLVDDLYARLKPLTSRDGKQISKTELLGQRPLERSKLAILCVSGVIKSAHYDKLVRIKKLRDLYVHPRKKGRSAEKDALTAMRLLGRVLKERFDEVYIIKEGKIVKR